MKITELVFLMIVLFFSFSLCAATVTSYSSLSARVGLSTHIIYEDFMLYDISFIKQITSFSDQAPWSHFKLNLHTQAGQLVAAGEKGLLASAGPAIAWQKPARRLYISAGLNLAFVGNYSFGGAHIGGPVQFFSHLMTTYNFTDALALSYSLQHLSNADLYFHNPGMNLHSLGVVFLF